MKHIITPMIFVFICLFTVLPASAAPSLSLGSAAITQGSSGTMNLSLSGGTEGYAGINAKLKLPDGINISGISRGGLLSDAFSTDWLIASDAQGRYLSLISYSRTATFTGSGVLLTLMIQVDASTPPGQRSINFVGGSLFINAGYALSNATGTQSVQPVVSSGIVNIAFIDTDNDGLPDDWELRIVNNNPNDSIISIANVLPNGDYDNDGMSNMQEYTVGYDPVVSGKGIIPGNLDGDTEITLADVILGLQLLSDTNTLNVKVGPDVNGDGRIGIEEVIYLLQIIATIR